MPKQLLVETALYNNAAVGKFKKRSISLHEIKPESFQITFRRKSKSTKATSAQWSEDNGKTVVTQINLSEEALVVLAGLLNSYNIHKENLSFIEEQKKKNNQL